MKKFDNIAKDQKEKAFRRGWSVPPGAVNVAWAKSPTLNPKNNTIIIDTSRISDQNANSEIQSQQLAFANYMGVLEDADGNQIWEEEYPIISDIFLPPPNENYGQDFTNNDILPYVHISRFFHVDLSQGFVDNFIEYTGAGIKVVYKNQNEYVDSKGKKRYKIFVAPVECNSAADFDTAHRVYVFLDMNPGSDMLYLKYNKVEISLNGSLSNQQIDYQETINPHSYFKYVPEESDVVDYSNINQKIYSTKPVNLKKKLLDLSKSNYQGWKVYVPRKALADPRIFQLFRWRLGCEFTRSIAPEDDSGDDFTTTIKIKVGVIIKKGGTHLTNRANYLFHQLNNTDYNFSKVRFYNPLKTVHSAAAQHEASYWHVDIDTIKNEELKRFDVLIWATSASALNFTPYLQKIDYFVGSTGGTLIIETSSGCNVTGLNGITFSPKLTNMTTPGTNNCVTASSMRLFDATASNPNDEFSSYGKWKEWPPNIQDIITCYTDTGSILTNASPIAGWDLDDTEKSDITAYDEIPNTKFQYISAYPREYKRVLEAQRVSDNAYQATMIHKKFVSGGNIFISTGAIFEDHLFEPSGDMIMRTMNLKSYNNLGATWRGIYNNITSSHIAAAEMKLRINTMMLATVFQPSPEPRDVEIDWNSDKKSFMVYTKWFSAWVINPADGVLNAKEINDYKFVLQTVLPTDLEPVWQRRLNLKTLDQLIRERMKEIDPNNTSEAFKNSDGCTKRYFMISTNPLVEVPPSTILKADSKPVAWTEAYSPKFVIPYYRGPYIVRDEMIPGTGVGQGRRIFPPKSWAGKISATYLTSSNETTAVTTKLKMSCIVKRDLTIDDPNVSRRVWHPPTTQTNVTYKDTTLKWTDAPLGYAPGWPHQSPDTQAIGIETWTDSNYHYPGAKQTNWPHWERWGRHGHPAHVGQHGTWAGSYGVRVRDIQRVYNLFIEKGLLVGPYLAEDGYFGVKTHDKTWAFQRSKNATYVDGVVDSETFSLMGHTLRAIQFMPGWDKIAAREGFWSGPGNVPYPQGQDYKHWAWQARYYLDTQQVSASWGATGGGNGMMRQSNFFWNQSISQTWFVRLNPNHPYAQDGTFRIFRILICPWGYPSWLTWMDVSNRKTLVGPHPNTTTGYPGPVSGQYGYGRDPRSPQLANVEGHYFDVRFPEKRATSVAFTTKSDGNMRKWFPDDLLSTHSRLALSEVQFHIRKPVYTTSTTPGYWQTVVYDPGTTHTVTKTNTIKYEANLEFKAGRTVSVNPMDALAQQIRVIMADEPPRTISARTVSSIKWDPASVEFPNDPTLVNYMDITYTNFDTRYQDRNIINLVFNGYGLITRPGSYIEGPWIGKGLNSFYLKTISDKVDPNPMKYGWITKDDGIKLVCDVKGKPLGFPALPIGSSASMHFANYILDPDKIDQTTYVGLWDNKQKEWIYNAAGDPEITYYDYIRRGPLNIYMGVYTTYELDISSNLPSSTSPIERPFKWAMPVYGVTSNSNSRFSIAPLPPNLSSTDIWPLPIKTGRFDRPIQIKSKKQGSLTGPMANYQGKTVVPFYGVPEAQEHPWSQLYGRPFVDIVNEQPILADDNMIRIRQPPILQVQEPTATPSLTDPWVPIMKVETRRDLTAPWIETPLSSIQDYDLVRGIITLKKNLALNDARLARVSYTSDNQVFYWKHDGTNRINLNPYINGKPQWRNVPLYVYLLPLYVVGPDDNVIAGTTRTRTLKLTTDPSIFSPTQANYDPLAIMLGVVYITTSFDINDLSILDTRRRGGGVTVGLSDGEIVERLPEGDNLWDVVASTSTSYQKGGFVIVRLPHEIINKFTREEVMNSIDRNVSVGTGIRLETLDGELLDWIEAT